MIGLSNLPIYFGATGSLIVITFRRDFKNRWRLKSHNYFK